MPLVQNPPRKGSRGTFPGLQPQPAPMEGGESLEELGALLYMVQLLARIVEAALDAVETKRAHRGRHAR